MTDDIKNNETQDTEPLETETSVEAQEEAEEVTEDTEEPSEADILRRELAKAQSEIEDLKAKNLRTLAEMQTVRRTAAQNNDRARNQGMDSVILSVLPAYDDLRRALEATSEDPSSIIPGVEQVRETIKRNLESLGISEVGQIGETFDPQFHEALTAMPTEDENLKGTIAQVFEAGFVKDERVIRVARVVVYQE